VRNLYLTGLPGSGKSTVGALTARLLSYRFYESEEDILWGTGGDLQDLWDKEGEDGVRFRERVALLRLAQMDSCVVALTDGALLWENNRVTLEKTGLVIYLARNLEKIAEELPQKRHPTLARGKDSLPDLWEERAQLFEAFAERFSNDGPPEQTARQLAQRMIKENDRYQIDWSQYR